MTAALPGPDGPLTAAERCLIEGAWQYLRSTPYARRQEIPGGVLFGSALPTDISNVLYWHGTAEDLGTGVKVAREFFGPKVPWRITCSDPAIDAREPPAAVDGLRAIPSDPGMLLDPIPAAPARKDGLVLEEVRDLESFGRFTVPWANAFRVPRWALPAALPRVPPDDAARGATSRFLVGSADGRPVACSTVTVVGHVAGIFSVGTVRAARGRGFGTAMTWAAIEAGRALGATTAYLRATPSGYPVYEKMGFRRTLEYPSWGHRLSFFGVVGALWRFRGVLRELRSGDLPPYGPPAAPPPAA